MARKKGYPQSYFKSLDTEGKIDCYKKLINFFASVVKKYPSGWNLGQLSRYETGLSDLIERGKSD